MLIGSNAPLSLAEYGNPSPGQLKLEIAVYGEHFTSAML
jgi:hypothetical protein